MEKIIVNKNASIIVINSVYEKSLRDLKCLADKGIQYPKIQFNVPNYGDGHTVYEKLRNHGVKCMERGMGSNRLFDGSYEFNISLEFI